MSRLRGMGLRPAPIPPLYPPSVVAEAVLLAAIHERRRIIMGGTGAALAVLQRLSPAPLDRLLMLRQQIFRRRQRPEPDDGRSNLYEPQPTGGVAGSYGHLTFRRSAYTSALGQPSAWSSPARIAAAALAGRALR